MSQRSKDKVLREVAKADRQCQKGYYIEALNTITQIEIKANYIQDEDIWYLIFHRKGKALYHLGRFDEALKTYETIVENRRKLLRKYPKNIRYQLEIARTLNNTSNLLSKMGLYDEVILKSKKALIIYFDLLDENPSNTQILIDIGKTYVHIGAAFSYLGSFDEAKIYLETAHRIFVNSVTDFLQNPSNFSDILSIDASCLNNLGNVLKYQEHIKEAKEKYEEALVIKELLVRNHPDSIELQLELIGFLINLGNLLTNMDLFEEAKSKYEKAFILNKKLLKKGPSNGHYQLFNGDILSRLGTLYFKIGRIEEAKSQYKLALETFTEPLQYMALKIKSRVIIQLIQLNLSCAETETNPFIKSTYLKEAYVTCKDCKNFFDEFRLKHEKVLAMKAGLNAFIEYSMLSLKETNDSNRIILGYNKSIQAIENVERIENDDHIKELLSSYICYLKGRKLINESLKFEGPDIELIKKAKYQFRSAKSAYEKANLCYCIYSGLLELEYIEDLEEIEPIISILREVIKELTEKTSGKTDSNVISAFEEIIFLLENKEKNKRDEFLVKLNEKVQKVDYYALRQIFGHTSEKLAEYLKEPFSVNIDYSRWRLIIKISDPENVKGILTIKAGNKIIFDEPILNKKEIVIPYKPQFKREDITFKTSESGKIVVRPVDYKELIEDEVRAYILENDCSPSFVINKILNIAIVQLKYEVVKEDSVIKLKNDKESQNSNESMSAEIEKDESAYKKKIKLILEKIKDKAKIVVFPEFSIPFEYLPEIQEQANLYHIIIVAGSHYVTDLYLQEYTKLFVSEFEDKDLRKNVCPIIIPNSKIIHTEKMFAAKLERKLLNEDGMISGELNHILKVNDNLTIGILVCFEYLMNSLKERLIEVCDIILVPQTNPEPNRFIKSALDDIDNPQYSGNKTFVMANGVFPFERRLSGGNSCVISTLDKYSHGKQVEEIESIQGIYEQFILLASIDTGFNPGRDIANAQVPIKIQYIPIIEEKELLCKVKADLQKEIDVFNSMVVDPEIQRKFMDEKVKGTEKSIQELICFFNGTTNFNKADLTEFLENKGKLIEKYLPLMYKKNIKNIRNLTLDEIKSKCCVAFIPQYK